MWNEPAASTDGSAPAETPEQPEPAYESKQDEPSGLDPRAADPRTPEAPAPAADEEDADPLASLPADFAAFSLTQTHPRSGDAKIGSAVTVTGAYCTVRQYRVSHITRIEDGEKSFQK